MADDDLPPPDRHAYLEEQIARQQRGEPIDVDWVRAELARIRREQAQKTAAVQKNLRWLVIVSGCLLAVLWLRNGGVDQRGGVWLLAAILIAVLAAVALSRRRR
jgi:Flp pilus assembly protein TadB